PYLSTTLQTKVKTYLNTEIQNYPPHTTGYYSPFAGKQSAWAGAKREYFSYDPNQDINVYPGIPVNMPVIYAVWLFSNNTNDWTYVTQNYAAFKSIYTTYKTANPVVTGYPDLSGVIAFARIAKKLNNTADYNDAIAYAESGFTAGVNFTTFAAN